MVEEGSMCHTNVRPDWQIGGYLIKNQQNSGKAMLKLAKGLGERFGEWLPFGTPMEPLRLI
jgi:hypothetical protein